MNLNNNKDGTFDQIFFLNDALTDYVNIKSYFTSGSSGLTNITGTGAVVVTGSGVSRNVYVDQSGLQPLITSSVDVTMQDLTVRHITASGAGMSINGGAVTLIKDDLNNTLIELQLALIGHQVHSIFDTTTLFKGIMTIGDPLGADTGELFCRNTNELQWNNNTLLTTATGQPLITSSVDVTMQDLTVRHITASGSGMNINGGLITLIKDDLANTLLDLQLTGIGHQVHSIFDTTTLFKGIMTIGDPLGADTGELFCRNTNELQWNNNTVLTTATGQGILEGVSQTGTGATLGTFLETVDTTLDSWTGGAAGQVNLFLKYSASSQSFIFANTPYFGIGATSGQALRLYGALGVALEIPSSSLNVDCKGALTTVGSITSSALTANRVLYSDASKVITSSSVTDTTLGYLDATSSIQTQLNAKQATVTAGENIFISGVSIATFGLRWDDVNVPTTPNTIQELHWDGFTVTENINLTTLKTELLIKPPTFSANKAMITDGSGFAAADSAVTATEIGHLSGVTSAIQTQINGKNDEIATTLTGSGATTTITMVARNMYFDASVAAANQVTCYYKYTSSLASVMAANLTEFKFIPVGVQDMTFYGAGVGIALKIPKATLNVECKGALDVVGALTKGSGSFEINHVVPSKKHMKLRHYFVETPSAGGNIYKYQITVNNTNTYDIELPDYFNYLNENVMVWVCGVKHFGNGYGEIVGENCRITTSAEGVYNVFIFGDRCDDIAKKEFDKFGIEYDPEIVKR